MQVLEDARCASYMVPADVLGVKSTPGLSPSDGSAAPGQAMDRMPEPFLSQERSRHTQGGDIIPVEA